MIEKDSQNEGEDEQEKLPPFCGIDGYPACARIPKAEQEEGEDETFELLDAPEQAGTAHDDKLVELTNRVNQEFTRIVKEIFGDLQDVTLPGTGDRERLAIRVLLGNTGFRVALARNLCLGSPPVDLDKIIKAGRKTLLDAGESIVIEPEPIAT